MKGDRGFTFLEVMIAFSLIALVLVGVFQLQSQNIALGVRARFNSIAPFLARQKLAEIITTPEDLSNSMEGDFGDDMPGYRWHAKIADTESEYFPEMAKRLKRIEISIQSEDQEEEYRCRTYHFFDREF